MFFQWCWRLHKIFIQYFLIYWGFKSKILVKLNLLAVPDFQSWTCLVYLIKLVFRLDAIWYCLIYLFLLKRRIQIFWLGFYCFKIRLKSIIGDTDNILMLILISYCSTLKLGCSFSPLQMILCLMITFRCNFWLTAYGW